MFEGDAAKRLVGVALALVVAGCGGANGGSNDAGAPDASESPVDAGDAGEADAGAPCDLVRCDAPTPVCEPGSGTCVECTEDVHCPQARPACDPAAHACVTCVSDSNCPSTAPRCDTEFPGGRCLACLGDADCGGATPTCDAASGQCIGDGDACASAKFLDVSPDAPTTITVDTSALHDDTAGFCSTPNENASPEAVYRFTLAEARDVIIQANAAEGAEVDPVLYVRDATCDGAERACVDRTGTGGTELLVLRDLPAGDHLLFVEAFGGTIGTIDVTVTLPEGAPANDACENAAPLVAAVGTQTITFDTFVAGDDAEGSCGPSANSPEGAWAITVNDPLNLHLAASAAEGVIPTVFLREGTCAGTELECASLEDGATTLSTALLPGTYLLFVESDASGLTGPVTVTLDFTSAPAGETCAIPGQLNLPPDGSTQFSIDTSLSGDDEYSSICSWSNSPDLVYELTLTQAQDVTVVASPPSGSGADAILWMREGSCPSGAPELDCVDQEYDGYDETMFLQNLQPGTYYLFVETYPGYAGALDMTVSLAPPTIPTPGESCASPAPVTFTNGIATFQVDTSLASDEHGSSCGSYGNELVYALSFKQTETVTVTATAPSGSLADPVLYLREAPCSGGAELECVDTYGPSDTFTVPNLQAGDYYLFIETWQTDVGVLDVTVQISP